MKIHTDCGRTCSSTGITKTINQLEGSTSGMPHCSTLELTITPSKIHFLKFILEGYDGMAIQSTIDPKSGKIKISYPHEMESDLNELLTTLKTSISPIILP